MCTASVSVCVCVNKSAHPASPNMSVYHVVCVLGGVLWPTEEHITGFSMWYRMHVSGACSMQVVVAAFRHWHMLLILLHRCGYYLPAPHAQFDVREVQLHAGLTPLLNMACAGTQPHSYMCVKFSACTMLVERESRSSCMVLMVVYVAVCMWLWAGSAVA